MVKARDIVAAARSWVGVPFLHQGRNRSGIDCVGLVIVTMQQVGLWEQDFERRDYGRMPTTNELHEKLAFYFRRVEEPEPGAIIGVRWSRELAHVAIFTGETIIHAFERRGKVIEHGYRAAWPRKTASVWVHPEVTR